MDFHNLRQFPLARLRRLRHSAFNRRLMQDTYLNVSDLIYPIFVIAGNKQEQAIPTLPGISRLSVDLLIEEAQTLYQLGIPAIMLFPYLDDGLKDNQANYAYDDQGLIQNAIRAVKQHVPELGVITDVALDPYTNHGQDGIIDATGHILNDETVDILVRQALSHAQAGADVIAPSDMMDGRIKAIREALEAQDFVHTNIMAYSAKYASSFYGPFRDAVGSKNNLGKADKFTYQLNFADSHVALHEVALDIQEGADSIIVKPGLPYLDILYQVKQTFKMPTVVYHVSGEYAMLKAASKEAYIEEQSCVLESLLAMKRAGANAIISYYAKQVAQWLQA